MKTPTLSSVSRLRRRAALGVLAPIGVLVSVSPAAAAVNAPHHVGSLSGDDGVILDEYTGQTPVRVELVRGGLRIGTAGPFTPGAGIEVNHVGSATCWSPFTPDVVNGDVMRVIQGTTVETSEVRNVTVNAPVDVSPTQVNITGTAQDATGARLDEAGLGVRLVNAEFQNTPGAVGPSLRRAATYDGPSPAPAWTAVFLGLTAGQHLTALSPGTEVAAAWESADLTESTENVFGAAGGSAVPDCAGVPYGRYAATKATPNVVSNTTPTLVIEGAAPLEATSVSVTLSDANALNDPDPQVAGTLTQPAGVGGKTWSASFADNEIDDLDDGTLTATPTFNPGALTGLTRTVLKNGDGEPPVAINTTPTNPSTSSNATFTFSSPVGEATFECKLDAGAFAACGSPQTYVELPNGPHNFQVRALDGTNAGTPASFNWTINRPLPVASVVAGPPATTNGTTANFTLGSTPPAILFDCDLDGGGFNPCSATPSFPGLAAGPHSLVVRATDSATNLGPASSPYSWSIDLTPPNTTITEGPANGSNTRDPTATFAMTSTESPALFECKVDAGAFVPCPSPTSFFDLPDGTHTVQIRAKDEAGNVDPTPAQRTWSLNGPPNTILVSAPPATTTATTGTFAFSSPTDAAATFECSLDGAPFAFCTTPFTVGSLTVGTHTFRVRAVDDISNVDPTPATHSWTVTLPDKEPPAVTTTFGPGAKLTIGRNGILVVPTSCDERCTIVARVRVVVTSPRRGGKTRIFNLTSSPVDSPAGATSRPRVKLNGVQLAAVRAALRAGQKVRITGVVTATDTDGNRGAGVPVGVTLTRRNL